MNMSVIKIFGLPRSCTNVTEAIINKNFKHRRVLTNFPDWKHGENKHQGRSLRDEDRSVKTDDLKFVICLKNPYNWLWSLHNFENKTKWGKSLRRNADEFIAGVAWHYQSQKWSAIDAYNHLTRHWLTMYKTPDILLKCRHEEIVSSEGQVAFCQELEKYFGMKRRRKDFHAIQKTVLPACRLGEKTFQINANKFNAKQVEKINNLLDEEIVKLAGYQLIG